jgi:DNA replication licensing factor MCM2
MCHLTLLPTLCICCVFFVSVFVCWFAQSDAYKEFKRQQQRALDATKSLADPLVLPQETLRKYILYSKQFVKPQLVAGLDVEKTVKVYQEMRQASNETASIPVTARDLDSLVRIAQAYARMHLRNEVEDSDMAMAFRVTLSSLIDTQRQSNARAMRLKFQPYLAYNRDSIEIVTYVLQQLVTEHATFARARGGLQGEEVSISKADLRARLNSMRIQVDLEALLSSEEYSAWASHQGYHKEKKKKQNKKNQEKPKRKKNKKH